MPAKLIIVLERSEAPQPIFRLALWADVPATRQFFYAQPGKVSEWKNASAPENAALAAGQVLERIITYPATPGATLAQIQAALIAIQQVFQAEVTADNPWIRYGTFYDGASWTLGGVT